jgi:hypothetical protein
MDARQRAGLENVPCARSELSDSLRNSGNGAASAVVGLAKPIICGALRPPADGGVACTVGADDCHRYVVRRAAASSSSDSDGSVGIGGGRAPGRAGIVSAGSGRTRSHGSASCGAGDSDGSGAARSAKARTTPWRARAWQAAGGSQTAVARVLPRRPRAARRT